MRTSLKPGLERTLSTSNMSADYCDVLIAEEQITLRFERQPDGVIRCTSHMVENSDVQPRASRHAFDKARRAAVEQMNTLRGKEVKRATFEEPIVCSSNLAECVISYANNSYSYFCEVTVKLTWENLRLAGVFSGKGACVFLHADEERKLKQRAFSCIQSRRREHYADDGLGLLKDNPQLSFAI